MLDVALLSYFSDLLKIVLFWTDYWALNKSNVSLHKRYKFSVILGDEIDFTSNKLFSRRYGFT